MIGLSPKATSPLPLPARRLVGGRPQRKARRTSVATVTAMLALGLLGATAPAHRAPHAAALPTVSLPAAAIRLASATAPSLAGRIAVARNSNGSGELFATDTSGDLVHSWACSTCAGGWSGWQTLATGSFTGTPAAAVDATGRMELAVRTTSGALDLFWQSAPAAGPWTGPVTVGGGVSTAPTFATWPNGRLEVFATGGGQAVHAWQNAPGAGNWSGEAGLGGSPMAGTRVAVGMNTAGYPEVFMTDSAGQLVHSWFTASAPGGWSPFLLLQPQAVTGSPAVGRNADGRLEVFARATDGTLYHTWQNAPSAGPWYSGDLGGNLSSSPSVTLAHPSATPNGALEVFSTSGGQVTAQVQEPSTAAYWSGWLGLGGSPVGSVAVGPTASGGNPLLAMNTANGPMQAAFTANATVNPWAPAAANTSPSFASAVVAAAQAELGLPYVWGGGTVAGPTNGGSGSLVGFDCSGLTLYAIHAASGGAISLPHSSQEQATMGTPVPPGQMQPGDLIFFQINDGQQGYDHVGIYIGNGQMIDAPTPGQNVRIDTLAPYWTGLPQTVRRFG